MEDIEIELEACTPLHTLHSTLGSEILTCTGTPALECGNARANLCELAGISHTYIAKYPNIMVRKSVRTYSAIEREFQALEKKEAFQRRYYQPLSLQVREASIPAPLTYPRTRWSRSQHDASTSPPQASEQLHGDGRMSSAKHRYADQLDWADDISMLTSVDDPIRMEQLQRGIARAASAYAANRQQAAGSALGRRANRRPTSAPSRQGFTVSGGSALQVSHSHGPPWPTHRAEC